MDRTFGKPAQQVAVAGEIRHTLSEEDRRVLSGIAAMFGVERTVVDGGAREVE